LFERRRDRALVIVRHDKGYIREHCARAAVLDRGVLHSFDDIQDALTFYQERAA
jgi:capsular polysaccharide transport system ATP-binding protein